MELRSLFVRWALSPRSHLLPLASALKDHRPHAGNPSSRFFCLLILAENETLAVNRNSVCSALFGLPLLSLIDPHFVPAWPFSVILTAAEHNHTRLARKHCFLTVVLHFRILWSTYKKTLLDCTFIPKVKAFLTTCDIHIQRRMG